MKRKKNFIRRIGGQHVILENSGHWPQWEEPEEFNKAHIEYLLK